MWKQSSPHRAVGGPGGAAAVHPGVHVDGNVAAAVALPDHLQRPQHGAAVVPVPVRQDDAFDLSQVEAEPLDVALEHRFVRPGVEQQRPRAAAGPDGDRAGEPMRRAAQAAARQRPHAARKKPRPLVLDEQRRRRQVVGDVVDEDQHLDPVGLHEPRHFSLPCV